MVVKPERKGNELLLLKSNSIKEWTMQIRVLLLLLWTVLSVSGCAMWGSNRIILHPIEKADIQQMKKGQSFSPEKDGYFLSELYLKEVVDAKVERKTG